MIRAGNLLRIDSEEELIEAFHIKDKDYIKGYYYTDYVLHISGYDIQYIIRKNQYPVYLQLTYTPYGFKPTKWEPIDKRDLQKRYADICAEKECCEQVLFDKDPCERDNTYDGYCGY